MIHDNPAADRKSAWNTVDEVRVGRLVVLGETGDHLSVKMRTKDSDSATHRPLWDFRTYLAS